MRDLARTSGLAMSVVLATACAPGAPTGESGAPGDAERDTKSAALSGQLSLGQIMTLAHDAGLPCDALVTAGAVAMGESGGYPDAENYNTDGSADYGLWQINTIHSGSFDFSQIFDPAYNAYVMASLSDGGSSWQPWVAYTNGSYWQYVDDAEAAFGEVEGCGGGGGGGSDACSSLGYTGTCIGDVSIWYDASQGGCRVRDCASEGRVCAFFDATPSEGYGCQGGNSGASTIACAELGYRGACYGDVVVWEDAPGACRFVDCAARGEVCADAGEIGFDCALP